MSKAGWKLFQQRIPEWRERYLQARNMELVRSLADPDKSHTGQFGDTKAKMDEISRILTECLGHLSKLQMTQSLLLMIHYGMIDKNDLNEFSEVLRNNISIHLDLG